MEERAASAPAPTPLRSANDTVNLRHMMVPGPTASPREFGAALRAARERSDVRLDVIAERTKIGRRLLEALEAGDFAKLPNRVFVRLFLQQYLGIVGERPEPWMESFEVTWQRFEDASQPWEVSPPSPSRGPRWVPWLIGSVVVAGGLAALMLIERGQGGPANRSPVPTPEAIVVDVQPTAVPVVEPTPAPVPTLPPGRLVLRAVARPCWIEVRIAGARPESRLLQAGEEWSLDAAGRAVTLVAGDAGALQIDYLGERRERLGADGQVARLQLGPGPGGEPGPTP